MKQNVPGDIDQSKLGGPSSTAFQRTNRKKKSSLLGSTVRDHVKKEYDVYGNPYFKQEYDSDHPYVMEEVDEVPNVKKEPYKVPNVKKELYKVPNVKQQFGEEVADGDQEFEEEDPDGEQKYDEIANDRHAYEADNGDDQQEHEYDD